MKITFDTNVLPATDIIALAMSKGHNCVVVTVTGRELEGTDISIPTIQIPETGVWGESRWGDFVYAGEDDALNEILTILSIGAFAAADDRRNLSDGQRRQLRDAMIFAAHVREKHDIFVTRDARAFIKHGKRDKLQHMFNTRIMSVEE